MIGALLCLMGVLFFHAKAPVLLHHRLALEGLPSRLWIALSYAAGSWLTLGAMLCFVRAAPKRARQDLDLSCSKVDMQPPPELAS